jgi:hypothetical protein
VRDIQLGQARADTRQMNWLGRSAGEVIAMQRGIYVSEEALRLILLILLVSHFL